MNDYRPSDLLGNAVLTEVRDTDRVLDMGTGSGINAILAASRSTDVVAVDLNPAAGPHRGDHRRRELRRHDPLRHLGRRLPDARRAEPDGTSGDLDHLYRLIDDNGFSRTIVASRELVKPEMTVWYHTLRLERDVRG